MYRMNFNPYQSVRFRLAYNHISFYDRYAQELYRASRGLYGTNSVYEASAILIITFTSKRRAKKCSVHIFLEEFLA